MFIWKCNNCATNNFYPKTLECECCGEAMSANQIEETSRLMFYKQRAEDGDSYAIMNMAELYAGGELVVKDFDKALEMMTNAAQMGNADAQSKLAYWYFLDDNDFPTDYKKAFEWAQKCYDSGYYYCMELLARCYMEGKGVARSESQGLKILSELSKLLDISMNEILENYSSFRQKNKG